MTTILGISA